MSDDETEKTSLTYKDYEVEAARRTPLVVASCMHLNEAAKAAVDSGLNPQEYKEVTKKLSQAVRVILATIPTQFRRTTTEALEREMIAAGMIPDPNAHPEATSEVATTVEQTP